MFFVAIDGITSPVHDVDVRSVVVVVVKAAVTIADVFVTVNRIFSLILFLMIPFLLKLILLMLSLLLLLLLWLLL